MLKIKLLSHLAPLTKGTNKASTAELVHDTFGRNAYNRGFCTWEAWIMQITIPTPLTNPMELASS
jgi:hypothetical protein